MDQKEEEQQPAPSGMDEPVPYEVMSRAQWERIKKEMNVPQK